MKHLKIFETAALFEAARATLDLPNVSLIDATMGVNYLPYVTPDPYNNHAYVEIGGVKWATMNIGASSVTDKGLYFQWGDTQGYTYENSISQNPSKIFSFDNGLDTLENTPEEYVTYYKYVEGDPEYLWRTFTKYNQTDNKYILEAVDDPATAAWGGSWRTPTKAEFEALIDATDQEWTDDYNGTGVAGMIFGTTEENVFTPLLFFPATGYFNDGGYENPNTNTFSDSSNNTYYWSSYHKGEGEGEDYSWGLYFNHDWYDTIEVGEFKRSCGITIRPVSD